MKKREAEEDKEDRKLQIESDGRVEKAGHGPRPSRPREDRDGR